MPNRHSSRFFSPVDIASLAAFRIIFGAMTFWEVWRSFSSDRISRCFLEPSFLFTYPGFAWVKTWPEQWLYIHFFILGGLALLILVGLFYRLSMILFVLGYAYIFLLDQSLYQNHSWLVCLLGFLMIFLPAARVLSVDAWLKPGMRSESIPAWPLLLLRGQIALVYLFAGISLLNPDWLAGDVIRNWLAGHSESTLAGPLIPVGRFFSPPWVAPIIAWGSMTLMLLAAPLLLWRRSRAFAFLAVAGFTLANARIFGDAGSPWFMIAITTIFFAPDWPRRVFNWPRKEPTDAAEIAPVVLTSFERRRIISLLAAYLLVQACIPLRHFFYSGPVGWTGEGSCFAWRYRIDHKNTRASFTATDPATGESWPVDPADYLVPHQLNSLNTRPELILRFAHLVSDGYREQGRPGIEVRAAVECALNGREHRFLINPTVNLAAEKLNLAPSPWIMPLEHQSTVVTAEQYP